MPGLNHSFFYLAFRDDERGQTVPALQPTQAASQEEAVRRAKELENSSVGVVAWVRHAEPSVGELGPPVIIYRAGRIGDFD
ncbi:conserved protein of unknown function [Pseudorhizobium banfieldiae]|uniref:Uncharacterized protein n=1 Tax=Pseudorhizobium banfieldiae TaxID=1125847 RepID=L0NLB9_9HYPH|nr:conserved protein of unknown function [Pseudorhizobium banfieldiae]